LIKTKRYYRHEGFFPFEEVDKILKQKGVKYVLDFFVALSSMLSSSPMIAITGSLLWGVASILLSPCHLASIPLIVGYIDSQGKINTGRAALIATLFSVGILITIAVIGIITGLAGRMMGDIGQSGNIIVAILMVIIGLYLLGIVPLPFLTAGLITGMKRKGLLAAFLLGLFFGLALAMHIRLYGTDAWRGIYCASTNMMYAIVLVGAYAVVTAWLLLLQAFTEVVNHLLKVE
jgi:cytochrome c-type biogenesis protein